MDKRVALITGCSSGIGRALAEAFRRQGFLVVATARRAADVASLRHDGWDAVALDVTKAESIALAVAHIKKDFGRLDVLVNNAGYGQFGALLDLEPDDLRRQFETNVFAPLALVRAALPCLLASGDARVVNIGSVSGILTTPFAGAYCASKAALHSLSDALRMELAPFGIHVITVQPGAIASRMGENGAAQVVLPPDSLYQKIAAKVHARAVLSQTGASPAAEFAKQLVAAVTKKHPSSILRLGSFSSRIPFLRRWLPLKLLDQTLAKRFGLTTLP
jgi:NAD(P)-dependent dehydrogenase (short-subunit alcohol dehydrogenase family)